MFWKRPPIRPLRLLGVTMLVITAIITFVPEDDVPLPGAVTTDLAAVGDAPGPHP